MWLINTHTGELTNHVGNLPEYAILSHCWGAAADEVSFKDFRKRRNVDSAGHRKVEAFCELARREGFAWAWADTCCIDKRSSAELSEAINSMWAWYAGAAKCYVYLADVDCAGRDAWTESRWFTRAWTLQELIAPRVVAFYDSTWTSLGQKEMLSDEICVRTRIPTRVLRDRTMVNFYNVAKKMSWAAGRSATRAEDIAYSLLGIFKVNMPLLYGEGPEAFQRLQLEILRQDEDESIFTWGAKDTGEIFDPDQHDLCLGRGVLASIPDDFAGCGDLPYAFDSAARFQNPRPKGRFRAETHQYVPSELRVRHTFAPLRATSWGLEMHIEPEFVMVERFGGKKLHLALIPLAQRAYAKSAMMPWTLILTHGGATGEQGPTDHRYRRSCCVLLPIEEALAWVIEGRRFSRYQRSGPIYLFR